jgi:hypothetical protein
MTHTRRPAALRKWIVSLAALAAVEVLAGIAPAHAQIKLFPPASFNGAPVAVVLGAYDSAPAQAAIWRNLSTGACVNQVISDANGLTATYQVHGSAGNDIMIALDTAPGTNYSICGFNLISLRYNGHHVDLMGDGGNDTLVGDDSGSVLGDVWLHGGDGNDRLSCSNPFQASFGGNGNDTLYSFSTLAIIGALYGEAGTDCIQDASPADIIDCGDGIDYVSTALGQSTRINPNCENRVAAACP